MALSSHEVATLRVALQDAVVKCSERCLYQSAKWLVAESPCLILLNLRVINGHTDHLIHLIKGSRATECSA